MESVKDIQKNEMKHARKLKEKHFRTGKKNIN